MKTKNKFALWTLIPIILLGCNKGEKPPIDQEDMWACHHETAWDSLQTNNTLIGEWEWEYIGCYWNPEDANCDEFKGLTIEFNPDNTLNVKQNGQITQTSSWKVVDGDIGVFKIDVNPYVNQVNGSILFCNNRIEFYDSYIDGCDNYFKRIE